MRHSCAHLLAAAVSAIWPQAKVWRRASHQTRLLLRHRAGDAAWPQRAGARRAEDARAAQKKLPFLRQELPIDEAIGEMARRNQTYKVELLKLLKEKGSTAVAARRAMMPWCPRGRGHGLVLSDRRVCRSVSRPARPEQHRVGAFKLTTVAGAYWRGDERNPSFSGSTGCALRPKTTSSVTLSSWKKPSVAITVSWRRARSVCVLGSGWAPACRSYAKGNAGASAARRTLSSRCKNRSATPA